MAGRVALQHGAAACELPSVLDWISLMSLCEEGRDMALWRLAVTACLLVVSATTWSHAAWAEAIGQIKTLTGTVFITRTQGTSPAQAGDLLEKTDALTTGVDGSVGITFIDNSRISIGPNSHLLLEKFEFNPTTQEGEFLTTLERGTLAVISGHIAHSAPDAMKVKTRTTILGVRGTRFVVQVEP